MAFHSSKVHARYKVYARLLHARTQYTLHTVYIRVFNTHPVCIRVHYTLYTYTFTTRTLCPARLALALQARVSQSQSQTFGVMAGPGTSLAVFLLHHHRPSSSCTYAYTTTSLAVHTRRLLHLWLFPSLLSVLAV